MGKVTCGRHGAVCCWRCDACPKCDGTFTKVGRGDYCPKCTQKFKAEGYVFSKYREDYVKAEDLPADLAAMEAAHKRWADHTCCGVQHSPAFDVCQTCKKPLPLSARAARIEQTEAGAQTVIEDTPARSVPEAALKPAVKQTEKPFELELSSFEEKQEKLL